jgi:hypothetical protein
LFSRHSIRTPNQDIRPQGDYTIFKPLIQLNEYKKGLLMKLCPSSMATCLVLGVLVSTSHAGIFNEVGDAGDLPVTSQLLTPGFNTIRGHLTVTSSGRDIDVFAINIDDPAKFSATIVSSNTTVMDTRLYLFAPTGVGIVANDDDPLDPLSFLSTIPVGYVTVAGLYYIAISEFPDRPLSDSGVIFPDSLTTPSAASTDFVTNTGPGGADPVSSWDQPPDGLVGAGGRYEILLTGVPTSTVPEPSTLVSLSLLTAMTCFGLRRRTFACE